MIFDLKQIMFNKLPPAKPFVNIDLQNLPDELPRLSTWLHSFVLIFVDELRVHNLSH